MVDLTPDKRAGMPAREFAEPAKKAYPLNDHVHQSLAIGGAEHAFHAGHITMAEKNRIQGAARAKLAQHKAKKKVAARPAVAAGPQAFGSLAPMVQPPPDQEQM